MKRSFDNISSTDISNAIDEWIHNERNRNILKRRLIDGILFEKLAEDFELTPQQVKNIVRKGTETIFMHLQRR